MHKIIYSDIVKNAGKLLSANVVAQLIGLLAYPVLSRLFSPEEFGVFNHFTSICGILVVVSTLELYNAIVLPPSDDEARSVVYISCIPLAVLVLVLALSIPFAAPLSRWLHMPDLQSVYWLIPISVLLGGLWNILNYWYIRRKAYNHISGYQISQSSFSSGYKLLAGFAGWTNFGLIVSSVAAQFCSLAISIGLTWKHHIRQLFSRDQAVKANGDIYPLKQTFVKYANFPKFSFPRSIINFFFGQLPVLALTPVFGTQMTGYWGMALMLAFMPINMITRSLYQSLYEHTTESVNTGKHISFYFRRFTRLVFLCAVPFFAGLYVVLPLLTGWLLGEEWTTSGYLIRWMLPWLFCSLLTGPTCFLSDIFFKQKLGLWFEILMAVLRTIGVVAGIWLNSFEVAIAGYCIGSAIACGAQYIWLLSLIRRYEQSLA